MNTLINQYFVYGILVPYNWYETWEAKTNRSFFSTFADYMNDNVDTDDIIVLFDGRDGKFMIVGKMLETINDSNPIIVPELEEVDKYIVETSIREKFGLTGEFHYYFVKKYL